jgi:hypothetical protein
LESVNSERSSVDIGVEKDTGGSVGEGQSELDEGDVRQGLNEFINSSNKLGYKTWDGPFLFVIIVI